MGAAEIVVLVGLVLGLFWLLGPLRRRLERTFATLLRRKKPQSRGRVVVLGRRADGTFSRRDDHDG